MSQFKSYKKRNAVYFLIQMTCNGGICWILKYFLFFFLVTGDVGVTVVVVVGHIRPYDEQRGGAVEGYCRYSAHCFIICFTQTRIKYKEKQPQNGSMQMNN